MAKSPNPAPRAPRFDLRQARAFLFVADELHFGRAAARLFMTQPALSRTIRSLEESVAVSLFERSTRRVRLTPAGEAFAAECRLALGHLDRAAASARNAAEGREGRMRVGYMDFAINGRLPQILKAFRSEHPQVTIDLEYIPTAMQHTALLEGRIDVGFVIGAFRGQDVLNQLVDEDDFVALLPEGHRLATRASIRLADLSDEPFVLGSEGTFGSFRQLLFPLCRTAGFHPNIVQEASNTSGIFGMVAAGVGVTIYAGCARNFRRAGVVVKPLSDVREKIATHAAWLSHPRSEVLERFREFL
jgi:DNA-binding transcriptional LysR family regulator